MQAALIINGISFYDAPTDIEGSPYWVDLWGSVNGYRIGLQVKPKTYKTASLSIYSGKARGSQENGYKKFERKFGGKVFVITPEKDIIPPASIQSIAEEEERLSSLPRGPFEELG